MSNKTELESLLNNNNLQQIENTIVDKIGCDLYKDNLPLLTRFIKEEVDASMLSVHQIENFLENNRIEIIDFALMFLSKSKPQSLSIGISITYSIYMIYLKKKETKEFLEYLKKRRIPKAQKFLEELLQIKREMNL